MSKKGGKQPKAPKYEQLAQQQSAAERATAQEITAANRPTQENPYGRLDWSQDENGNWKQTETWDPRITELANQNLGMQSKFSQQAAKQGEFKGPESIQYDPNAGNAMADALYENVMGRARKEQERERTGIDTQLRQQGLQPGTEAYDRAMQNLMTSQGDVATRAALEARLAGGQEARDEFGARTAAQQNEYNQKMNEYRLPWEQLATTQSANAAIPRPEFAGVPGATGYQPADLLNARQKQYEVQMGGSNANNAKKGNTLSGGLQAAASIWG